MIMILLTAMAGGLGAAVRFGLDSALTHRLPVTWARLMIINVSGSALLGLLAGLASAQLVPPAAQLLVGAGFLGGYTTFSAASLATVHLVEEQRWLSALGSSLGILLASLGAASLGLVVGRTL